MENIFWLVAMPVALVMLVINPIAWAVPFLIFMGVMVYRKWTAGDREARRETDHRDYHW